MHVYSRVGSKETLSSKIKSQIEGSILEKKFLPGDKLPTEMELCTMFGVSRTVVREALRMLTSQGLIAIRKGSGIFVSESNSDQITRPLSQYLQMNLDNNLILKVVEVRKVFEPQIASMAAQNRDDQDLIYLQKYIHDQKNATNLSLEEQGVIDQQFHRRICESAKNPIISLQMDPIFRLMPEIGTVVYSRIGSALSEAVSFHQRIFSAIRDGDEGTARTAMVDHLVVAERHAHQILG